MTLSFGALSWRRHTAKGENPVPCGDCAACCRDLHAVLDPTVDRVAYTVEVLPDGRYALARKPDGTCLYLDGHRCGIYAQRPAVCRGFDCRALLVADRHDPLHVWDAATKKFAIVCKEPGDAAYLARVRARGALSLSEALA